MGEIIEHVIRAYGEGLDRIVLKPTSTTRMEVEIRDGTSIVFGPFEVERNSLKTGSENIFA